MLARVLTWSPFVLCITLAGLAHGHDAPNHSDPELLAGWLTWFHLTVQWIHLVAFALWFGVTAGTLVLGLKARLDRLLLITWMLLLAILGTGTYNMEWSAGISATPSILMLPMMERIPYGIPYTISLAVKMGLFAIAVVIALGVTVFHMVDKAPEKRLASFFLFSQSILVLAITFTAAVVLFYHEAADLWPTPIHSSGGVLGPKGPLPLPVAESPVSPPNDFQLLSEPQVWVDILARWAHLIGFGLWLGGSAAAVVFGSAAPGRFLVVLWAALAVQAISGVVSMHRWAPFYLPPYLWNLEDLSHLRFGRTYTLWMAAKHVLVFVGLGVLGTATCCYLRALRRGTPALARIKPYAALNVLVGLVIGYIMMVLLLLHEGVDHAL